MLMPLLLFQLVVTGKNEASKSSRRWHGLQVNKWPCPFTEKTDHMAGRPLGQEVVLVSVTSASRRRLSLRKLGKGGQTILHTNIPDFKPNCPRSILATQKQDQYNQNADRHPTTTILKVKTFHWQGIGQPGLFWCWIIDDLWNTAQRTCQIIRES